MELLHNSQFLVEVGAFLFKIGYFYIAVPAYNALMRELFLYYTEQRRFTDAIVADDAYFFASADFKIDTVHKSFPRTALAYGYIHALDFEHIYRRLNSISKVYLRRLCIMNGALDALHFFELFSAALSHFSSRCAHEIPCNIVFKLSYLLLLHLIFFFASCIALLALADKSGIIASVACQDSPFDLAYRGTEPVEEVTVM